MQTFELPVVWDASRPALLAFIRERLSDLNLEDCELPDEERGRDISFAPGAWDGIATHHTDTRSGQHEHARSIATSLARACAVPTEGRLKKLYQALLGPLAAAKVVDELLPLVSGQAAERFAGLRQIASWLVNGSPDREAVKYGISLFGLLELSAAERDLLEVLGRHNEFALFVSKTLASSLPAADRDGALWQLARNIRGWGRVHIVEQLAETGDARIKDWMLREGFRNSIEDEYLAYVCAVSGDLVGAMRKDAVDVEMLASASDLLRALVHGGPAQDIRQYADGVEVLRRFQHHVAELQPTYLGTVVALGAIRSMAADDDEDWVALEKLGWTAAVRAELAARTAVLLTAPRWAELIREALSADDETGYFRAGAAAAAIGMDIWQIRFDRQAADGSRSEWYWLLDGLRDAERADRVVALALAQFDLTKLGSGPSKELGFGPDYRAHLDLDFVVRGLSSFPGVGWQLVRTALNSPVIRNRYGAIRTVGCWVAANWTSEIIVELDQAIDREPDEKVRAELERLLAGAA